MQKRFENTADLFLEDRNIVLNSKPNLFDIDAEIIMNQLVAHPGDIIPRNFLLSLRISSESRFVASPIISI